jgi:nitroreductase
MNNDILSMGASIEHILLSATNEGLGSLWLGVITEFEKELNTYLNINDKKLVSGIILGYKNDEPANIIRKEFEDVVKFY